MHTSDTPRPLRRLRYRPQPAAASSSTHLAPPSVSGLAESSVDGATAAAIMAQAQAGSTATLHIRCARDGKASRVIAGTTQRRLRGAPTTHAHGGAAGTSATISTVLCSGRRMWRTGSRRCEPVRRLDVGGSAQVSQQYIGSLRSGSAPSGLDKTDAPRPLRHSRSALASSSSTARAHATPAKTLFATSSCPSWNVPKRRTWTQPRWKRSI